MPAVVSRRKAAGNIVGGRGENADVYRSRPGKVVSGIAGLARIVGCGCGVDRQSSIPPIKKGGGATILFIQH
jgi:hypothetical protein